MCAASLKVGGDAWWIPYLPSSPSAAGSSFFGRGGGHSDAAGFEPGAENREIYMRRGVRGSRDQTILLLLCPYFFRPISELRATSYILLLYRSASYVAAGTDCIEKSVIGYYYYYYRSVRVCVSSNQLLSLISCLLYTSPSPRDGLLSRMPSSA